MLTLEKYTNLLDKNGLHKTWSILMNALIKKGINFFNKQYFDFNEIGHYYEIGLAYLNKVSKKDMGKYFTPTDVARLMARLLCDNSRVQKIVDTGCGCGNLIIEVLMNLKRKHPNKMNFFVKNLYLYDIDKTALLICEARILALFKTRSKPHIICGDFLSKKVAIPKNSFVIANPPYSKIVKRNKDWSILPAMNQSKDLYVGFIEKIISSCKKAVIVSPQSFIVGPKFSILREKLIKSFKGEIYSFDNVPGSLFFGKKEGVFNSNTSNAVRASIMCLERSKHKGFYLTHLIRFKNTERKNVLNKKYLKSQLGSKKQNLFQPLKCFKELESFVYPIIEDNAEVLASKLFSPSPTEFRLCVSSSARYFTLATQRALSRNGYYFIYMKKKNDFYLMYSLLNSSYCYLFWRMFDGGILYPKSVLCKTPLPFLKVKKDVKSLVDKMIRNERNFLRYKKNAGANQESVKFPKKYREQLNKLLFGHYDFELIHKNNETL